MTKKKIDTSDNVYTSEENAEIKKLVKDLSVWEWLGLTVGMALLAFIPFIGLIASLGLYLWFAFGDKFKGHVLRNYSRATLIISAITAILVTMFIGTIIGMVAGLSKLDEGDFKAKIQKFNNRAEIVITKENDTIFHKKNGVIHINDLD